MATAPTEVRVGNGKYRVARRLGGGSFGEVFKAVDIDTKEVVAVKLEQRKCKVPQLVFEARLLKYLHHHCLTVGIPQMRWYGSEGDFNVMVLDLLGPSLEKLFLFCNKKFTPKTLCMIAIQLLCRVELLHAKSFIHRDIKPDNFVMGTGKRGHHVYMIDFGLAKKFQDPKTRQHIPFKEGKTLTGTARYVSVFTHLGMEQSRRDDLESVAYMLIYFSRGSLPWQGFKGADRQEKYDRISEKKMSLTPESLCKFQPTPLLEFLAYARSLEFDQTPDYNLCRSFFQKYMEQEGYVHDYNFDWTSASRVNNDAKTVDSNTSVGQNSSRGADGGSLSGGSDDGRGMEGLDDD